MMSRAFAASTDKAQAHGDTGLLLPQGHYSHRQASLNNSINQSLMLPDDVDDSINSGI